MTIRNGFRPLLGIIFLSLQDTDISRLQCNLRFRPRIGDYFFYLMRFSNRTSTVGYMFPSPYWGLFFYPYAL